MAYDAQRAAYLETQGFRILRFTDRDGMTEISVVLAAVDAALVGTTPTPGRSRQGGGER